MSDSFPPAATSGSPPAAADILGIDGHAHVFTRDLPLTAERRYAPSYDATPYDYLAMLDGAGLSHGVLVQPSFLGTDNRYLLDSLAVAPQRLRGIVQADPVADLAALPGWHAAGIVGVRANLIGKATPAFDSPHWRAFLDAMAERDWHLEVQVEAERLASVGPLVLARGVRLVVDHFGRFDPLRGTSDPGFAALLAAARAQFNRENRIWVKISAAYRVVPVGTPAEAMVNVARTAYRALLQAFGPERLLWGSDWPHTQFESTENPRTVVALRDAIVDDAALRRALLIDTPTELFGFDRQPAGTSGADLLN
ncbi:amidohydrolase family protein [Robbsia sp. KACC 23696]|uniref:amidohydrolase family protein n=1 Tax=Robbsia sp. KACC 23696 TaxID=3149231 RepID=UPI00325B675B